MNAPDRRNLALTDPPDYLADFPRTPPTGPMYRAHSVGLGPWYFASSPGDGRGGRFDVIAPHGSCYVASTIEAAVRERLGPAVRGRLLPDDDLVKTTAVAELVPRNRPTTIGRLADTDSTEAAGVVTREISTTSNYILTQAWANKFRTEGFAGVRYLPRFTPGSCHAEAWFGPSGPHDKPFVEVNNWRKGLSIRGAIDLSKGSVID